MGVGPQTQQNSFNFDQISDSLDGDIDGMTLESEGSDVAHIYSGDGGATLKWDQKEEYMEVEPWSGQDNFKAYPNEGNVEFTQENPEYEGALTKLLDENYSTDSLAEAEAVLQETYDQIMSDGPKQVDPDEAVEKVEEASEYVNQIMDTEGQAFTNVILHGDNESINDVHLLYGPEDRNYGPNETGPEQMRINTGDDHTGYSATPVIYNLGRNLLQNSDKKPEVSTGFAYKDKSHHKSQNQQANPVLKEAFEQS